MNPQSRKRSKAVRRVEQWLRNHNLPRLQMSLILALTGLSAALFSFLLLRVGLEAMWLRYPVAIALAYAIFLLLLRVWLHYQTTQESPLDAVDSFDLMDAGVEMVRPSSSLSSDFEPSIPRTGPTDFGLDGLDLDELILLLIALLAVGAGIFICLYLVWIAPAFLAELFVDGIVMAGVYHRLQRTNPNDWFRGALRRTWLPALAVAFFFGLAGLALQALVPEAKSIGPVLKHFSRRNAQ